MLAEVMSPAAIRQAQSKNPRMRPRDLAVSLGISEAEYVAAWLGDGTRCISCRPEDVFPSLAEVGPVMALTRNACAVHEMIGIYETFSPYRSTAECHGPGIRAHLTSRKWTYGFAVVKQSDGKQQCSFQFFDEDGTAVQKIHTRPTTNMLAWNRIEQQLALKTDPDEIRARLRSRNQAKPTQVISTKNLETLFDGCESNVEYRRVSGAASEQMLNAVAAAGLPLVCKVSSSGCLQIYEGPVKKIVPMGPWINIMDDGFHMHLRLDQLLGTYVIRRTNGTQIRTSLEAWDTGGARAIYFSNQDDGSVETEQSWKAIIADLPRP